MHRLHILDILQLLIEFVGLDLTLQEQALQPAPWILTWACLADATAARLLPNLRLSIHISECDVIYFLLQLRHCLYLPLSFLHVHELFQVGEGVGHARILIDMYIGVHE